MHRVDETGRVKGKAARLHNSKCLVDRLLRVAFQVLEDLIAHDRVELPVVEGQIEHAVLRVGRIRNLSILPA